MLISPGRATAIPAFAKVLVAVCLVLTLLSSLAGCSIPGADTSKGRTGSFGCTEAGGSAHPCSQAAHDAMSEKDAHYAEAEDVFRRLVAEDERTARLGGGDTLTPIYSELLAKPTLRAQQLAVLRADRAEGVVVRGGHFRIHWLKRRPELSVKGSVVTVQGCVDLSSVIFFERGRRRGHGIRVIETAYLRPIDDRLRVWAFSYRQVETCG